MVKDPIFAVVGLLLALATVVLFVMAGFGFQTGVPGIFTMLVGGFSLLLGFNSQASSNSR